ncbi:MAG TPA: hypothetical protein VFM18_10715 [Methanosarcina sp.]|nr:hypothetical protein [Methanosarcina sp.]
MNYKHFWISYVIAMVLSLASGIYVLYSEIPYWSIAFFCVFMALFIFCIEAILTVKPYNKKKTLNDNSTNS